MHEDRVREILGTFYSAGGGESGVFYRASSSYITGNRGEASNVRLTGFKASRVVPTGAQIKPRAFGILACVYLGS